MQMLTYTSGMLLSPEDCAAIAEFYGPLCCRELGTTQAVRRAQESARTGIFQRFSRET